ncbi:hypothetical protein B4070_2410 [Bacillus subtilis]|nr:hypothetical protein B4070_2410 [Bacillus subtilis]
MKNIVKKYKTNNPDAQSSPGFFVHKFPRIYEKILRDYSIGLYSDLIFI